MNSPLVRRSRTKSASRKEPGPACIAGAGLGRRAALSLMSAGVLSTAIGPAGRVLAAAPGASPRLATPEQVEAERLLLGLLKDPELAALQAKLKADLAATPRGRTPDGAARLDEAIAQWTNSLIFGEISDYRRYPAFLWATDDTSRTWLGHTIGGVGTSGDNPDAIYRMATIDGGGRYEIRGQIDLANRPAQLIIEADKADLTRPADLFGPKRSADVVSAAATTDKEMVIAPDGSFRITVNGSSEGPNHFTTPAGRVTVGVRDMLSNWNQRACRLSIRRLDKTEAEPFAPADLRRHMLEDLPGYIRFWSAFPDIWMGGLKPNSFAPPMKRNSGWGFVSGLRFQLSSEQALIVTTTRGGARYTGFQLNDPWMIAPDARRYQCCLNLSQVAPDEDGAVTYVISLTDPGVANWLDPAGIHDGLGIMRWQNIPAGMTTDGLIRDFRVIPLAEVQKLPGIARVTSEQRRRRLAARATGYNSRVQ